MGFFNHTPKNRKFDYSPRYYDESKERLDAIKKKHENPERAAIEARIRGQLQRHATRRQNIFMRTGFRFLLILAVLLVITYLILTYFDIPLW